MKRSPRLAEPSLHPSECHIGGPFPERHYPQSRIDDTHSTYFEDAIHSREDSEAFLKNDDCFDQQYGDANDFSQSHMPNIGLDAARTFSHDRKSSEATPLFAGRNDNSLLRGVENYSELSSPNTCDREIGRAEVHLPQLGLPHLHNMHRKSTSLASPDIAPMQLLPYPSSRHSSAPPQVAGQSNFAPFRRLFNTSEDAKRHRHIKMRFDRHAYDESDETIALVEANRQRHVERIYNAMTRGDLARDNAGSTAMKRWTREPHYPPDLIEAYAHKVFDCLLEQAKEGFRGWHHNDYVADDRKGDDEDRDVNCAGRLDNVITALEQEKAICEDVMNSACQIRMFVNAPKAYSNRKHQNRVGNSKRPGAKANPLDADSRPSKVRKTASRRGRTRSSSTSDIPAPTNTTPQPPRDTSGLPHLTSPHLRISSSSPSAAFLAPRAPPMQRPIPPSHRTSFGQHQVNAMSPRAPLLAPQLARIQRIASMSPTQQSTSMSPPAPSHGHFLTPASPGEAKSLHLDLPLTPWQHAATFGESSFQQTPTAEDSLFTHVVDWSQNIPAFTTFTPGSGTGSVNYFEHHPEVGVSLADVEQVPSNPIGDSNQHVDFSDFWSQQQGVQSLPFNNVPSEYQDQP